MITTPRFPAIPARERSARTSDLSASTSLRRLDEDPHPLADLSGRVLQLLGTQLLAECGGIEKLPANLFEIRPCPVEARTVRHDRRLPLIEQIFDSELHIRRQAMREQQRLSMSEPTKAERLPKNGTPGGLGVWGARAPPSGFWGLHPQNQKDEGTPARALCAQSSLVSEWPGPGSNRRPSAFQADARTN